MSDVDVDRRLSSAGDKFRTSEFRPPALDDMLLTAMRPPTPPRRLLAVALAAVVVLGTAIGVSLVHTSADHGRTGPIGVAPTITVSGQVLHYLDHEAWKSPVLDEHNRNTVYVYAEVGLQGKTSWGTYCEVHPVAMVQSETAKTVAISVSAYASPPRSAGANGCFDIAYGPARLAVVLAAPLGNRTLVDAYDDKAHMVLDAASVLAPTFLPLGYVGGQVFPDDGPAIGVSGVADRTYQGPGSQLRIRVGPASLNRPLATIIQRVSVRGHPATVSYGPSFKDDILIAWNEDSTHAASLYQESMQNDAHPPLAVDELVRVAQSLR